MKNVPPDLSCVCPLIRFSQCTRIRAVREWQRRKEGEEKPSIGDLPRDCLAVQFNVGLPSGPA